MNFDRDVTWRQTLLGIPLDVRFGTPPRHFSLFVLQMWFLNGVLFWAAFISAILAFWFPIPSLSVLLGSLALLSILALTYLEPLGPGQWFFRNIPLLGATAMSLWYLKICIKYNEYIAEDEMPANWQLYHNILCFLFLSHIVLLGIMMQRTNSDRLVASLAYVTTAWIIVFVIFQYCMGTLFKTCG